MILKLNKSDLNHFKVAPKHVLVNVILVIFFFRPRRLAGTTYVEVSIGCILVANVQVPSSYLLFLVS